LSACANFIIQALPIFSASIKILALTDALRKLVRFVLLPGRAATPSACHR